MPPDNANKVVTTLSHFGDCVATRLSVSGHNIVGISDGMLIFKF